MTYVSKKEKVFDLPEQDETSSISLNAGDNKLKSFLSVSDRRAWTSEEFQRYQHLYGLVKDSESNITKSSGFKYIPFDVLLAILMAEKDAYIQELLERQDSRTSGGKASLLYKSDGYEDSDDDREALIRKDAEVVALKNKIVGLGTQLEDYKDTLTKAMHKLETMDAIMSENKLLKEKIKCSEDAIKYLEGKKEELEKELEFYKAHLNIPDDQELRHVCFPSSTRAGPHLDGGDCEQVVRLSSEKDILIKQIEDLQRELQKSRADAAEVEILRKASPSTSINIEEICKENKCYKAKLESMKCLELYVEELKKQAQTLTEKYKRESQKASEHLKQININNKELQMLRDEREKLHTRINELTACESQYLSLKGKLQKVELIIDENEMLNKKLIQLDRLEIENEQLKLRIEQMKTTEFQAIEDKKVILQLQREVAQQEDEIKRMLKHISDLSSNYADDEICRLQIELEDKNGKLKKYEKQLDEIPVLESEIEELRHKLQKCIDEFSSDKDLLQRLQEELEACRSRCHELEEMVCQPEPESPQKDAALATITEEVEEHVEEPKPVCVDKGENTEAPTEDLGVQYDLQHNEDKSTFTLDETAITLQHLEEQNKLLKNEVSNLTMKLSKIDLDELIAQTNELKGVLFEKDERIQELETDLNTVQKELEVYRRLKDSLEKEVELYKERVEYMTNNLKLKEDHLSTIEETMVMEKKERLFATELVRTLEDKLEAEQLKREAGEAILKLQKEESNLAKQEIYAYFAEAMDHQKRITQMSRKLNSELQTENKVLKDMKKYVEKVENRNLKNLISKLRAEVKVLKSLSKPEVQSECESLQRQVSKLLRDTDSLIEEIRELRLILDTEKSAKDFLEREVMNLQAELSACVLAGNEVFGRELAEKEALILDLQKDLAVARKELDIFVKESEALREKNSKLTENVRGLEVEQKDLKNQINLLQVRQEELSKIIQELEEKEKENMEKVKHFEEVSALLQSGKEEMPTSKESVETLPDSSNDMEEREEILQKVEDYEEVSMNLQQFKDEFTVSKESIDSLQKKVEELEEELKVKEEVLRSKEEILKSKEQILRSKEEALCVKEGNIKALEECTRKREEELVVAKNASLEALKELTKVNSEVKTLRSRLAEREIPINLESQESEEGNYEVDLEEKLALEEALRKMESELDDLKTKLQECKSMEEEMANLRSKRDSLLEKMAGFESEIDGLKKKLSDFETLKNELEHLKSKEGGPDLLKLLEELEHERTEKEDFRTKNKGLKTENTNLITENNNLKTESENIKTENKNLKTENENLKTENENLKTENENLKEENGNIKTENVNMKAENESTKAENENVKTENKNIKAENEKVKAENENLKTENENLKEEVSKKEGLLEITKNLPKVIPEPLLPTTEFYTPPAVLTPRSSGALDPSEYVLVDTHKKEMLELETKYETQIQNLRNNLERENTERLKKLTEHYEKENNLRTRAFYESINTVKSSYENDIKKLVERHKLSIMRLQGLHEDEVQELNTTYETQMEAMQTQNENLVNDMRTEASEKYKQLREQQNCDLRELSRKYEDLLRECENRFVEEKKKLEESMKNSSEAAKEQVLKDGLSEFYQNNIAEMEEKHVQDLKKCKKSNMKRIELMKNKYEALLVEERKKYEEQLEEMLLQLQNGKRENPTGGQKEHMTQEKAPTANPNLEFNEVLHKILNEGLECLTFEELILVHSKTCFIPENSLEGDSGVGEFTPRLGRCCKHKELMAAEKEELLKKIFTLEHEMVIKQLETHEAIVNMEAAEFCRIRELKTALCTAQQKNIELKRLLSDQSKNEMGLKIDRYMSDKQASFHETNVVEKVKELEREKAEKRRLEEELQKERANSRNLTTVLETEKERHIIQRKRDADYVESIRQRLEEALNQEQKLEAQLDYEVKLRTRMEAELQNLRRSLNFSSEMPPPSLQIDAKAVKDIKNQDQSEVSRKSRHSRSKSNTRSKSDHQQNRI